MSMFKVEDQITTTGFLLQRPFHIFQRPQPYRSFWWRQFGKYFHPPWPLSDRAEVVICVSEANCNIYLGLEFLHAHGKVIVICCFTLLLHKGNGSQFWNRRWNNMYFLAIESRPEKQGNSFSTQYDVKLLSFVQKLSREYGQ